MANPRGLRPSFASIDATHRYLVAANPFDSTTYLWSLPSGIRLRSFTASRTTEAVVADSGRSVVTADIDGPIDPGTRGRVRVWDPETGRERFSRIAAVSRLERNGLSLSPDGLWIATRNEEMTEVEIWSARTGAMLRTLRGPRRFSSAVFSPRTFQIVTTDYTSTVRVWDAFSGLQQATFMGAVSGFHHAVFSPDGTRIIAKSHEGGGFVWELRSRKFLGTVFRRDLRSDRDMSPDASFFVVPRGRAARIVRPTGSGGPGAAMFRESGVVVLHSSDWNPSQMRWSADGRYLAVQTWQSINVWETRSGRLLGSDSSTTGRLLATLPGAFSVRDFEAGADDQLVVHTDPDEDLATLLNSRSGEEVAQVRIHTGIRHAKFSPDGQRLALSCEDNTVRIYDRAMNAPLRELLPHATAILGNPRTVYRVRSAW